MKAIIKFAGLLAITGMLGGTAVDANAATSQNINTHAAACNPAGPSQATSIFYAVYGVWNASSAVNYVVCPVARHPVTGPGQSFYVDGTNSGGQTTNFTLYSYTYTGTLESWVGFSSNLATYDLYETLTSASYYSYVSLFVTLPASGNGLFRGIAALDN